MTKAIALGPWPEGMDNVHPASHRVFQVPGQGQPPARLRETVDVDIDDEGWPTSRPGMSLILGVENPKKIFSLDGFLYVQGGNKLKKVVFSDVVVANDILELTTEDALNYTTFGAKHYFTNGVSSFVLHNDVVTNWGLPIPSLLLSYDDSSSLFKPGTYLVQASFSDAQGNEGGTSDLYAITLAEGQGSLWVTIAGHTSDATHVNIYVGKDKSVGTSFAIKLLLSDLDPGELDGTLITPIPLATTEADPPKTEQMTGPPAGLVGVATFRGYILGWRDNVIFRSEGLEPHLWHGDNIYQFPSTIRAVAPLQAGFWVGTDLGLYWVSGDDPEHWIPKHAFTGRVCSGSLVVEGNKLPKLQTADPVALFISPNDLIVGMPDGQVLNVSQQRYNFFTHVLAVSATKANFVYTERDGLRQFLVTVE